MTMLRAAAFAAAVLLAAVPGAEAQVNDVAARERELARQMALCPVKAEPASVDAGFVQPHSEVKFVATLRNTSGQALTCVRSAPSCTCTTLDMVGKSIPAGGTLEVPISMKTSGATGEKTAEVVLTFGGAPGAVQLKLKATVAYPVHGWQLNPAPGGGTKRDPFVNAFDLPQNVRGEVTVESLDGKSFRVLSVNGAPAVLADPARAAMGPQESWQLRYDLSAVPCERMPPYLVIETDRPDARLIDMRIRHQCTRISPNFAFEQFRENLGVMAPGETKAFELVIKRANGVRIDRVDSLDPRLESRLLEQKAGAGDEILVRTAVTARPDASGVVIGALRFTGVGPDPKQPVPPGQPAATAPRQSDFVVYGKIEQAPPAPGAAPAAAPAPGAAPGAGAAPAAPPGPAAAIQPLPVVMRIAERASEVPMDAARFARARAAVERGLAFLRSSQGPEGGWLEGTATKATDQKKASYAVPSAVTALAVKAFAQAGHEAADDRTAARAMAFLRTHTGLGGAFEPDPSSGLGTYVASTLLMALAAQQDDALAEEVAQVRGWLREVQWDQAEGHQPDSDWFGGYGYGNRGRPDLSNTQLVLDALHDAGVSTDDPAVQRALAFVARTQNIATNREAWAQKGTKDGGFVYTPAGGGESFSSEAAGEGRKGENLPEGTRSLRSYGSMTYAGLKSMLYAGLSPEDPRVRAAFDWIRAHYGFAENPGLGAQGHFYYLHTAARALLATNAMDVTPASADAASPRNWRDDLVDAVCGMQREDGGWKNPTERWMEGNPELATIYAVLALEEAIKPVTRSR
jgi:squalene-hopene/tetraprenyl-beta-curcumene cyclase